VNRKLKAALAAGLAPIVCVVEILAERESGRTGEVLKGQFEGGLAGLDRLGLFPYHNSLRASLGDWHRQNGNARDGRRTHRLLRDLVRQKFGEKEASAVRILYGGSV